MQRRKVRSNGEVKWRGAKIAVSAALVGRTVAIEETEHGWRMWFHRSPIGLIDKHGRKLSPISLG